jgi:RNAse (barnase) inhibitor barstar
MAWEVAIILAPNCELSTAATLASYMPIWIADTSSNRPCAAEVRRVAGDLWKPESACTTFDFFAELSAEENLANVGDAVVLHHPNLAKLNLLGIEDTPTVRSHMSQLGFKLARKTWENALTFRRPISMLSNVQHLTLSGKRWCKSDDVYDDLFRTLGSPAWHGKNFNALHDSIVSGQINTVEVPYTLTIREISSAKSDARFFVEELVRLISGFEAEGCPISIQVEE